MSDDIKIIIEQVIKDFDLVGLILDLKPTKEEKDILTRCLASYANLKIKERMGENVKNELNLIESTLSNLSFMNASKAKGLISTFSAGGSLVDALLNGTLDVLFQKVFEELNNISVD